MDIKYKIILYKEISSGLIATINLKKIPHQIFSLHESFVNEVNIFRDRNKMHCLYIHLIKEIIR